MTVRDWFRDIKQISIHAPREGSDGQLYPFVRGHVISIHAPREGSDISSVSFTRSASLFQSTLPVRGATVQRATVSAAVLFQSTLPVRGATHC